MRDKAHGEEDNKKIKPHGEIGEPAKFLEGADLANKEACKCPDQAADGVAEFELGSFRESFAIGDGDDGDIADELNCLQNVHAIAGPVAVEAEGDVAVGSNGVFVGVEACNLSRRLECY